MATPNETPQQQDTLETLNTTLGNASEKLATNKKYLFWFIGTMLIVAAIICAYIFFYSTPRNSKAFEAYNAVEITAQGNDSVAAAEYKKVADKFGNVTAGKLAALSAAEAYYNQGKYKEALTYIDKFSTSEPVLKANALVLKGDCQVNLKEYDKALSSYDKALSAASKNPQIAPRVLLKKANIYDEQKKYDKALGCYEQIKADFPTFIFGNGLSIDAYIAREKARLGK